jgi:general secretion pathway protein D
MLQLRKIYVHEELNALVIRDSPEVIKLAQQILEVADRADSEVVFDLELIEVSHSNDLNFGPKLSNYSVSLGVGNGPGATNIVASGLSPGGSTDNLVTSFSGLESFYTLPSATFDFLKTTSNAEVLAHPSIRVKNKEKAKVHIGTREPVVTVTFTGAGETRSDNVQYVDVGVKLDIEPAIQLDNSVITKLNLEVSSVSGRQTTTSGTQVLTITTTNAQTGLTLKDGERTIIGGLIRDELSKSRNTIPILGDIPLIGNLFTSHTRKKGKREILLSITPHIIKNVEIPGMDVTSIWSGAEDDLKAGLSFGSFTTTPADQTPEPASAALPQPPPVAARVKAPVAPVALSSAGMPVLGGSGGEENPFAQVFLASPEQVAVGEEFTITVSADAVNNLFSTLLIVNHDPDHIEFLSATEGSFLAQGGAATTFVARPETAGGRVFISLQQQDEGGGASGGGDLCGLSFRAKKAGPASIRLGDSDLRTSTGKQLPIAPAEAIVEVL